MKKTSFGKLLLLFLLSLFLIGCSEVSIEKFNLSEDKIFIELGDDFKLPNVKAIDSKGNELTPVIVVKDEDGNVIEIENNTFVATTLGIYEVTYTVTLNKNNTISKSFEIEVFDLTKPVIENEYEDNIYAPNGMSYDLNKISVSDNSGENITPVIDVFLNGDELDIASEILELNQEGTYVIQVTAEDSSGNKTIKEYKVFTVLDAESQVSYDNEFVHTQITDKFARSGKYSYEVGVFDTNISWFNDNYLLGKVKIDTDKPILSFWILFDTTGAGFNGQVLYKYFSHETKIFNAYGDPVEINWQNMYEIDNQRWYRFEVDMTKPQEAGKTMEFLSDYFVEIGVWDYDISNNATKPTNAYIDDIKIVDRTYDFSSEYDQKKVFPIPTEDEPVVVVDDLENSEGFVVGGNIKGLSSDYFISGEYSLKLEAYPTNNWITIVNLFPNLKMPDGYNRLYFHIYLPMESQGVYLINGLTNPAFYREIDGVYTQIQLSPYNTYEIPTNEWVLVGFDVTEAGVGFVVEGLYVNGEMHMDPFTVYLDDLVMLHESVFEVEVPVAVPTEDEPVVVVDDLENSEGFVVGGNIKGLSSDYFISGEYSLKLEAYPDNNWITIVNLFPNLKMPDGYNRLYFHIYLPMESQGVYSINGLTNPAFYREIDGVYTQIQLSPYNTYEIPTNEWVLVGFDVTEAGVGFVVEGLYVNGEMHMDPFTVYIDDLVMLHESVFEVEVPVAVPTEDEPVVVVDDLENSDGFVVGGNIKGLSSDYFISGEYSLKLEAYPDNNWITIVNLFPNLKMPDGYNRLYFHIYLPMESQGVYSINGLTNPAFYREIDGVYTQIQLSPYNTYEIPTNEWVLVGFDVTEAGVGFVVEGLYVNGEMHMDPFTVYIDDLVMLHESVFESNE